VHGLTKVVFDGARWITGVALVCAAGLLARFRPPAVLAAVLLWLTVWVFGVTFFLQYLVWGLPFLIMAGYLRQVLVLELALLPATVISYTTGTAHWLVWLLYTVPLILFWLASAVGLVAVAQRVAGRGRAAVAAGVTELAA
jgi:hypothetical protein